jgi:hypothetical protein
MNHARHHHSSSSLEVVHTAMVLDKDLTCEPELDTAGKPTGFVYLRNKEGCPVEYGKPDDKGRRHGFWKTFYSNNDDPSKPGPHHEDIMWHHGWKDGAYKEYYKGKSKRLVKWTGQHEQDKKEGRWQKCHDMGIPGNQPQSELTYFKRNKMNGLYIRQSCIGACMERGYHVDDKREGEWQVNGETRFYHHNIVALDKDQQVVRSQEAFDAFLIRINTKKEKKRQQDQERQEQHGQLLYQQRKNHQMLEKEYCRNAGLPSPTSGAQHRKRNKLKLMGLSLENGSDIGQQSGLPPSSPSPDELKP